MVEIVTPRNNESGFPTIYDIFSTGSELVGKAVFSTPAAFNTVAHSAVVDKHQPSSETKPIGVPGTSYSPDRRDMVYNYGGHTLIFGAAVGNETLRIQSKAGAAIEFSDDGSLRIINQRMHIAISGEGQIVLGGDLSITTTGAFKFKGSAAYFDVQDFVVIAANDIRLDVGSLFNLAVVGESHTTVAGDHSLTIGGATRITVGGNSRDQVVGDRKVETAGILSMLTKGKTNFSSDGDLTIMTNSNGYFTSLAQLDITSKGNTSISSGAKLTIAAADNLDLGSKSNTDISGDKGFKITTRKGGNIVADTGLIMQSKANTAVIGDGALSLDSKGIVRITADGNVDVVGAQIQLNSTSRSANAATVGTNAPDYAITAPGTFPEITQDLSVFDQLSDLHSTNGQVGRILHLEQLVYIFDDGQPSNNNVPTDVINRANQIGALFMGYPPPDTGYKDSSTFNDVSNSLVSSGDATSPIII